MNNLKLLLIGLIGLCSASSLAYGKSRITFFLKNLILINKITNYLLLPGKIVNCYYGTWANYRPGDGKFEPTDINPHLCTHLSYSFFGITPAGEFQSLDTWLDNDLGK